MNINTRLIKDVYDPKNWTKKTDIWYAIKYTYVITNLCDERQKGF